jgi:putative tricarboxylic transport membrane protein
MLVMGIVGFFLRKADFPIPPMVMAFLLGGMTENSFRQALKISEGGLSIFFASPVSILFLGLTVLFLGGLILREWKKKRVG